MDTFGTYGAHSDDEAVSAPGQPVEPEPAPSARADAVRHFIESIEGVEFDGQIVRPYARTGGRTRSVGGLELETLLSLTSADVPSHLPPEHFAVAGLCRAPMSVAELAGYRHLPIGAVRVIISDLIEDGVVVRANPLPAGAPTIDLMRRVLDGLHRL